MLKKYKILIVEDDKVILNNLNDLLSASGYQVYKAQSCTQALSMLNRLTVDLILCDIMMHGLDGFGFLEILNKTMDHPVPFIFLTAKNDMDSLRNGMNLGADDYICKPYKAGELLKAIEIRLEKCDRYSRPQNASAKSPALARNDTILVDTGTGSISVRVGSIRVIRSDADYSILTLCGATKLHIKKTLKEWESILPAKLFVRIHRSAIINISHIGKIEKGFNRQLIIKIKDSDEVVTASNRYSSRLKSLIMH